MKKKQIFSPRYMMHQTTHNDLIVYLDKSLFYIFAKCLGQILANLTIWLYILFYMSYIIWASQKFIETRNFYLVQNVKSERKWFLNFFLDLWNGTNHDVDFCFFL